jgi:hypothetical protein
VIRAAAIFSTLLALYAWASTKDYEDAQITEQHVAEVTARKVELSVPILYDATVTQVNRHGEIRTRFYSRSGK